MSALQCRSDECLREPIVGLKTGAGKISDDFFYQAVRVSPTSKLASEFESRMFAPGQQPNGRVADGGPALVGAIHDLTTTSASQFVNAGTTRSRSFLRLALATA